MVAIVQICTVGDKGLINPVSLLSNVCTAYTSVSPFFLQVLFVVDAFMGLKYVSMKIKRKIPLAVQEQTRFGSYKHCQSL